MTINELIKKAIEDRGLRSKLLSDPIQTCKENDIATNGVYLCSLTQPLYEDTTLMQGGYRP